MILLLNPGEFRDRKKEPLSFGREIRQANQAGRVEHSRQKNLEWSLHQDHRNIVPSVDGWTLEI